MVISSKLHKSVKVDLVNVGALGAPQPTQLNQPSCGSSERLQCIMTSVDGDLPSGRCGRFAELHPNVAG